MNDIEIAELIRNERELQLARLDCEVREMERVMQQRLTRIRRRIERIKKLNQ